MATISASLRLRPTRIGFLVSPTDMEAVRKIFCVCSCLWGGVYNPIIPVCDELPKEWDDPFLKMKGPAALTDGYIKFFEPDVYVECGVGLAQKAGIENDEHGFLHLRIVQLDNFFNASPTEREAPPFGLSIDEAYQDLFDHDFKFVPRHENHVGLFKTGNASDVFIEAAFGGFPTDGFLSPLEQMYKDAFGPELLDATPENWLKAIEEHYRMPLRFTAYKITREPGWSHEPTLFVVDPSNPADLIDLWNLRQFRQNVLPINIEWMEPSRAFLRKFIEENHRPIRNNPQGLKTHSTVQFGRSISKERAEEIAKKIFDDLPNGSWSFKLWYDHIWYMGPQEDHGEPLNRAQLSAKQSSLELPLSKDERGSYVKFASLAPEFAEPYGGRNARWVNVFEPTAYGREEVIATLLPSDFKKSQFPRQRLGGDGLSISREGWVLQQRFKEHGEYLSLMTGREAIIDWLEQNGVKATPSDPGMISEQILKAVGGVWGTHLLAHKETLDLLDSMAKSTRKYNDGKIEEFPDRAIPVEDWRGLLARRKNQRRLPEVGLDNFIKSKILKLGLSVQCPNCKNRNWYGLDLLNETLVCERCLNDFDFPQGSLDFKSTPWEYRVVGPFSVPDYARGGYATVLALNVFANALGSHATLNYSTNLDIVIDNASPQEIDFAFWYAREHLGRTKEEEPAFVVGEAKSFAVEAFKAEDVERLKKVAEKFPGTFLVFAVLKEELSDTEKKLIGELASWGREYLPDGRPRAPVIVLTGTEMFAKFHIQNEWKEKTDLRGELTKLPALWMDNLWTFADLTQQVYLGLPDKFTDMRRRREEELKAQKAIAVQVTPPNADDAKSETLGTKA